MKFAILIKFTDQGLQNVGQTTHRAAAFAEQAKQTGLEISELLWLSGRFDGLIVFDSPDIETASAAMLSLCKTGNVKTEMLPAFDVAAMDNLLDRVVG